MVAEERADGSSHLMQFFSILPVINKHDNLYEKGGDCFDRWIADIYLLKFCLQDSYYFGGVYAPYYMMWSVLYYFGVRIAGWKFFKYKK